MSIQDYIASYAEGWTLGDSGKIMSAVSPNVVLDDPNVGRINRDALPDYIAGLKNAVAQLRAGNDHDKLMEMSEIVIKDDETPVSIWAWFTVPGTALAGSALIKVTDEGVIEERIAYYTSLPK
jgi:hypothetical protein